MRLSSRNRLSRGSPFDVKHKKDFVSRGQNAKRLSSFFLGPKDYVSVNRQLYVKLPTMMHL